MACCFYQLRCTFGQTENCCNMHNMHTCTQYTHMYTIYTFSSKNDLILPVFSVFNNALYRCLNIKSAHMHTCTHAMRTCTHAHMQKAENCCNMHNMHTCTQYTHMYTIYTFSSKSDLILPVFR